MRNLIYFADQAPQHMSRLSVAVLASTDSKPIQVAWETVVAGYEVESQRLQTGHCSFIDKLSEVGLIDVVER